MKSNWANKTIWTADNLPVMRGMNSNSIDLIYLDPPFNSNADYAAPIGSRAAGAEFKDTWNLTDIDVEWIALIADKHPALQRVLLAAPSDSRKSYLVYMAVRLLEMHRILKPTGSIYLHCDPTMSHHLKLLMDAIFGYKNFRNEIIWERIKGAGKRGGGPARGLGNSSDCILFYAASEKTRFYRDAIAKPYPDLRKNFPHEDARGSYKRRSPFRPPGLGSAPNLCYEYKGVFPPHASGWLMTRENLEQADRAGDLEWTKSGAVWKKQRPGAGIVPNNVWTDINIPPPKERTGYPTQKPLALLRRIIQASSNEGDMVFDPFCGCATTLAAADELGRDWVGIDISEKAAELIMHRIETQQGLWRKIIHREDIPKRTDLGKLPAPGKHRNALYGEQGGNCAACGTHFGKQYLEVDHIIAKSKGGTDHIDNLQLLCARCNRLKGDRGMNYLRAQLHITGRGEGNP